MTPLEWEICWNWCRNVLFFHWGLERVLYPPDHDFLEKPGASFVTFKKHGQLRGCIGSLEAVEPLRDDLRKNTLASATRDPRFPPIQPQERFQLNMEISLLSPAHKLELRGPELLNYLASNHPGVILKKGGRRATFLPQVWEDLPDPESFLERLSLKAGLPASAWRESDVHFDSYTVEHYDRHLG